MGSHFLFDLFVNFSTNFLIWVLWVIDVTGNYAVNGFAEASNAAKSMPEEPKGGLWST